MNNKQEIKSIIAISSEYELLNPRIALCMGDALEHLSSIQTESIDCVITDPPYFSDGMGSDWNIDKLSSKVQKAQVIGSLPVGMKFDPQQGKDLQKFMTKISKEIFRIMKPGGFYICFSMGRLYHRMALAIEDCGFEIRDMLIWEREGQAKAFSQNHFVRKMNLSQEEKEAILDDLNNRKTPQLKGVSEPLVLAQKPKDGTFVNNWLRYHVGLIDTSVSLDGKFPSTVMSVPKPHGKERQESSHLTMKPVALLEHLIKIFSAEDAVICDPFFGSGSTAVACINTNRQFIGLEINQSYYEESKRRLLSYLKGES